MLNLRPKFQHPPVPLPSQVDTAELRYALLDYLRWGLPYFAELAARGPTDWESGFHRNALRHIRSAIEELEEIIL